MNTTHIAGHAVVTRGRFPRIARLRDEYYDYVENPAQFLESAESAPGFSSHLFTFTQRVSDLNPRYTYHLEHDSAAVLSMTTYDHWWKKQINDKTRNMVRKAGKAGVELRDVPFSDELVSGIAGIYNESRLRQGRPFKHYGKPFETLKKDHASFLDRSDFIGAYFKGELIGFIKLVHGQGASNLMQIISKMSHRDKAPTNALIAKAVERCTEKGIPLLHYGTWSRRNMGDFKKHHAFQRVEVPRYYVPLNAIGSMLLRMELHQPVVDKIPEPWLDRIAVWRNKWNGIRYRDSKNFGAVAQFAERRSQG